MNAKSHIPYTPVELQTRDTFVAHVDAACRKLGIDCSWSSDNWIATLRHNGRTHYIHGNTFPVNNASSTAIMNDKAATATVLQRAGIAVIPHYLLRLRTESDAQSTAEYALTLASLPVVLKPNDGKTSGRGVIKCETYDEAVQAITELSMQHQVLAVSPLAAIAHEYRVIVLHNKPRLVFEKIRQNDTWHHNLARGAKPHIITDEKLRTKLEQCALKTTAALDADLAAVDIVETPNGLCIIEVNAGLSLGLFSMHSGEYAAIARRIYADVIQASCN